MIQNMMRKAMVAGASGFAGVTLNFGTCEGYTTDFVRWWASLDGTAGDDVTLATSVSMSPLTPGATITVSVVASVGPAVTVCYKKNAGSITNYTTGFSVVAADYLKMGIVAPNQVDSGYGVVLVFADGSQVATIDYTYDPA